MNDDFVPSADEAALPDEVQRAIDRVRQSELPAEARQRARDRAESLNAARPGKTPAAPVQRSRFLEYSAMTGVAAVLLLAVLSLIGTNASQTFNQVGQSIGVGPHHGYYAYNIDRTPDTTTRGKSYPMRQPRPPVGGEGQPRTEPPCPVVVLPVNPAAPDEPHNTEDYARIVDNSFRAVSRDPLSTFSVDVDTASYSNFRRFLNDGQLPPKDAIRIEEMINYFSYDYPDPKGDAPVSINTELTDCPWRPAHRLLRIGLQGKRIDPQQLPARNLVFLIDVSGSMNQSNKLPLLKESMKLLVQQLDRNDRVAIVVYAGSSGQVLPATSGAEKGTIVDALERLQAGGSTNGGAGIQLAYKVAQENFIKGGVNRVILATDGDFNVGVSSQGELLRLIEGKRQSGVFLTILGYGMGNLKDATMEKLADHGNGHYAYIDTLAEARKVFVEEGAALVTIAKDVKLQLEFNPKHVQAYRLIGYENRILKKEDFNDDKKDAGDIGSGHRVTALYEIVPAGIEFKIPGVDDLKYQQPLVPSKDSDSDEALTVKLRYKEPTAETSQLLMRTVGKKVGKLEDASADQRWAAAVAALGMLLRDSPYKGDVTFTMIRELAEKARGEDKAGHKAEFIKLIEAARTLKQPTSDAK